MDHALEGVCAFERIERTTRGCRDVRRADGLVYDFGYIFRGILRLLNSR